MVHFYGSDALRAEVVDKIVNSRVMRGQQTIELIEGESSSPKSETVGEQFIALHDKTGGYDLLQERLTPADNVSRYIMTGGSVPACLSGTFRLILSFHQNKALDPAIEVYISADAVYSGYGADSAKKIRELLAYYVNCRERERSAAVWLDDELLDIFPDDSRNPQVRIRLYTTTDKLLKALS